MYVMLSTYTFTFWDDILCNSYNTDEYTFCQLLVHKNLMYTNDSF